MNVVDYRLSVDIRRARLARALGLGPSSSLILDMLGKADTGNNNKKENHDVSGTEMSIGWFQFVPSKNSRVAFPDAKLRSKRSGRNQKGQKKQNRLHDN